MIDRSKSLNKLALRYGLALSVNINNHMSETLDVRKMLAEQESKRIADFLDDHIVNNKPIPVYDPPRCTAEKPNIEGVIHEGVEVLLEEDEHGDVYLGCPNCGKKWWEEGIDY